VEGAAWGTTREAARRCANGSGRENHSTLPAGAPVTRPIKDLAKSVQARLLTLAKQTSRPFNEVMQLYAMERFLYRLSQSKHSTSFVLKGGVLLAALDARRPTRDIDLAASAVINTEAEILAVVREIAGIE